LFDNLGVGPAGYRCVGWQASPSVIHTHFERVQS
jgi:hypothetical protein